MQKPDTKVPSRKVSTCPYCKVTFTYVGTVTLDFKMSICGACNILTASQQRLQQPQRPAGKNEKQLKQVAENLTDKQQLAKELANSKSKSCGCFSLHYGSSS